MVDALTEAWRILVPQGTLLDLRPRSATYPIYVSTLARRIHVADFDGRGSENDDAASDAAIRKVVEDGWFARLSERHFDIEICWDTVREMEYHARDEGRIRSVDRSYAEVEKVYYDLSKGVSDSVDLRYCRPTMLSVYRKTESVVRSV